MDAYPALATSARLQLDPDDECRAVLGRWLAPEPMIRPNLLLATGPSAVSGQTGLLLPVLSVRGG